ncbi:hypothetical protein ACKWTF_000708 [Chironomus riparius]
MKFLYLIAFLALFAVGINAAKEDCKKNEAIIECTNECMELCDRPMFCPMSCITGCFCAEGYCRDAHGKCVPLPVL